MNYNPHNIIGMGNVGVIYKLLEVWVFSFISHWARIYLSSSFIRRFYLALVLSRLYVTLVSFKGCLSSHGVILLLGMINIIPAWPGEKYLTHIPAPGAVQMQRIQVGSCSTWFVVSPESSWSTMSICMCYHCFYSTLASMLPNKFFISIK